MLTISFAAIAAADDTAAPPNILLLLADNWAFPHASIYGDPVVKTPAFDRLAREGTKLTHAFCMVPSCAPARAVLLTGQAMHRLEGGANNWGPLPRRFAVYPELLAARGYTNGHAGKGWEPASLSESERDENPAGPRFASFAEFLAAAPQEKPFCFWFGSRHPHRRWTENAIAVKAMDANRVRIPAYLPDAEEVRQDILPYYAEVQAFDAEVAAALEELDRRGLSDNTLVIVAGDNGWQMPHGLANVYDAGTRVPLAIRWPRRLPAGRTSDALISFEDIAPTLLAAAGAAIPDEMTGHNLLPLLKGEPHTTREFIALERERHAHVRQGNLGYPVRAIRTREYLYVRNFEPDRWPAGDPRLIWSVGPFGDVDPSVTKQWILDARDQPSAQRFFAVNFARRPAEELYFLADDPDQVVNVAGKPEHAAAQQALRERLDAWMIATADPRAKNANEDRWDRVPYFGHRAKAAQ